MARTEISRGPYTEVRFTAEEVVRIEYAASYAAQGPLASTGPALLRRLEGWARRGRPVRARLDERTLRALLKLSPLYGAYRENQGETESMFYRAAVPVDEVASELEAKVQAALARLERAIS